MESAQPTRPRWHRSLKVTLAGAILATVSATAALVHIPWLLTSRQNINEVVAQVNDEIARSTSQEVSGLFDNARVAQATIAAALTRDLVKIDDPEQRASLYLSLMQANPNFAWIVLGFPNGDQLGVQRVSSREINLLNRRWNPDRQTVTRAVETFRVEGDRLRSLKAVADEQDFRVQDRPWYQAGAQRPGKSVWTDVYVFATDRVPGINASFGLEREGTFLGTISIAFELQRISRFLHDLRNQRASAIFITNARGELIAFSDLDEPTYVMSSGEELRLKTLSESDHPPLQIVSDALAAQDFAFTDLQGRQDFLGQQRATGETYYISLAPLNYDGLDWIVGTAIAESIYLQDIQRNNRLLYLTVSGFLLVAASAAVWLTGRAIAQPLLRIVAASEAIAAGNFAAVDLRAMRRRPDELGHLAGGFQEMSDEVYAREQRLKQQVQDLKIEINERQRHQEVSEIVETDFFQDLQAKARAIRRQRRDRRSA